MHPISRPDFTAEAGQSDFQRDVQRVEKSLNERIAAAAVKRDVEEEGLEQAVQQILRGDWDKMDPWTRNDKIFLLIRAANRLSRTDLISALAEYHEKVWHQPAVCSDPSRQSAAYHKYRPGKANPPELQREMAIAAGTGWKDDQEKFPWHMMPMEFLDWVSQIYHHGALKYAWDNWKNLDSDRMADAAFRHVKHHIEERQRGTQLPKDKDSGFDSLAHAACGSLMALWLAHKEGNDD